MNKTDYFFQKNKEQHRGYQAWDDLKPKKPLPKKEPIPWKPITYGLLLVGYSFLVHLTSSSFLN